MSNKPRKLILIGGLPGSGKSTLARELLEKGKADLHFEADMYFCLADKPGHPMDGIEKPMNLGEYRFDPDGIRNAHFWCQMKTALALSLGFSVVVANTFCQKWEVRPYLDIAGAVKDVSSAWVVARGEYQNIHNVPETVIRAMKARWEWE